MYVYIYICVISARLLLLLGRHGLHDEVHRVGLDSRLVVLVVLLSILVILAVLEY